ncbi:MAG: hypothetical protein AAGB31_05625 [Bdellovibrio sp.]
MKRVFWVLFLILNLAVTSSCDSNNVLTEYAQTDTDEALYLDARNYIDDFEWDKAIDILTTQLSAEYRAQTEVQETLMYAYGGKCGISLFDLIGNLKNVTSTKMFEFSLQIFAGKVVNTASCDNAFNTLMGLGSSSVNRTADQNLFAAILGLTKMSTHLHAKFDTDNGGMGNGVVDVGWNSCTASNSTLRLSDSEVNKIISGVGLIFENIAVLGAQLTSGTAGGSLTSALSTCESVLGTGNCSIVQESAVTPEIRRLFRRMISSSMMGFGTCDLTDMITPSCCPGLSVP